MRIASLSNTARQACAVALLFCIVVSGCDASEHGMSSMIRKLKSGEYRLYSRKKDPRSGKARNLGTFRTREAAEKHERAIQYFKRH